MEKRPRFGFGEVNEFAGWDNNANYGMHVVEILTRKGPRIGQLRDDPVQPGLPMGKMMLRELHTHTHLYTCQLLFSSQVSDSHFPFLKIHSQKSQNDFAIRREKSAKLPWSNEQ